MRIQLISANWPPDHCGVGDYSSRLTDALRQLGLSVEIDPRQRFPKVDRSHVEAIFLQYTPSLFGRLPNLRLEAYLLAMRFFKRLQVFINFHELYYPVEPTPRGLVYGVSQWLRFVVLCHIAHRCVFSTEIWQTRWKRRLPHLAHKFFWSPVGSNIPVSHALHAGHEQSPAPKRLVHFGGNHPTHLYPLVFAAAARIASTRPDQLLELHLIGLSEKDLKQHGPLPGNLKIVCPGFLPAHAVSKLLANADLVLQPFLDGISTRRGSVMAALAHGRTVVTTLTPESAGSVSWNQGLLLASVSESEFTEQALHAWNNQPLRPEKVLGFFDQNFSWSVIAARLKQIFVTPL